MAAKKPEQAVASVVDENRGIGGIWVMDPSTGLTSRPEPTEPPASADGLQDEAPHNPGQD